MAPRELHENMRIAQLPISSPDFADCTEMLKKPDGSMKLFPLQSAALNEAAKTGGGVFMLGCGVGKTLISLLLAPRMGCVRPLLLIPASLREKTVAEAAKYATHFSFPMPELLNYEMLSRPKGISSLKDYAPDLIICDEAHMVKDINSTRTQRLGLYLMENPSTKLVCMSGTLFNKSVADFAHLSDWALEGLSPVPRNHRDVYMWDALLRGEAEAYMHTLFNPMYSAWGRAGAREAVFNRLKSAQGVLLTLDEAVPCSLNITLRNVKLPDNLRKAINDAVNVEGPMTSILQNAGIEDIDKLTASQHLWDNPDSVMLHALSQMASGLLYFWEWENGVPDKEWLESRKKWRKAVRTILELSIEGFDSPSLIFDGFEELPAEVQHHYGDAYTSWDQERVKPEPPRGVVWISEYLIDDVEKWISTQKEPVLIWVDNIAFATKLSDRLGVPYYGGGVQFDTENPHTCVLSIASHGTGKNLQAWSNNLVVAAIASPQIYEQMIARTHRTGQQADTVNFTFYNHSVFGAAFNSGVRQAIVVGETTGQKQRIVYGDRVKG